MFSKLVGRFCQVSLVAVVLHVSNEAQLADQGSTTIFEGSDGRAFGSNFSK
jgi:hypothetical protein